MVKKIKRPKGYIFDERVNNADKLIKATVIVESKKSDGSGSFGTGFIVGNGNFVITAYHVIKDAQEVKVIRYPDEITVDSWTEGAYMVGVRKGVTESSLITEGTTLLRAPSDAIESFWDIDISIMHMKGYFKNASPLQFDTEPARMGEDVFFIGYPGGGLKFETNIESCYPVPLVTKAIVASAIKFVTDISDIVEYYYWLDRPSFPGNSGGPVLRLKTGKIIGVISATPFMPKELRTEDGTFDTSTPDGYSIAFGTQNLHMAIEAAIKREPWQAGLK